MFYTLELLSSQHQGKFAIAWIMATRGPKKLTNQQIYKVNVVELSNQIAEMVINESNRPRNRLSLRLSGILLYGTIKLHKCQVDDLLAKVMMVYPSISKIKSIFIEDEDISRRRRHIQIASETHNVITERMTLPVITDENLAASLSILQADPDLITLRDEIGVRGVFQEESFGTIEEPFVMTLGEKEPEIFTRASKRSAPPPEEMHVPKQKQPRQIKIIEKIEVQQPVLPKETITQVEEHHIASVIEQQPVQIEPIVSTEAIVPTIREERALPPIEPLVAMRRPRKPPAKDFFVYLQARRNSESLSLNFTDINRQGVFEEEKIPLEFENPATYFNDDYLLLPFYEEEEDVSALRQASSLSIIVGSFSSLRQKASTSSWQLRTPQLLPLPPRVQLEDVQIEEVPIQLEVPVHEELAAPPTVAVEEQPRVTILQETFEEEIPPAGLRNGVTHIQDVIGISMTKEDENFILNVINKWNFERSMLTIEKACLKPVNRINISKTFGFLLSLAKKGIVTLHHKPDSLELGNITKRKM